MSQEIAVIVGAGSGISAALARKYASAGAKIALVARDIAKLEALCRETGAIALQADASSIDQVAAAFEKVGAELGQVSVAVYNASARVRGSLLEIDPEAVKSAIDVSAFGAFLVVQQAARRMVPTGRGTILLTGATASLKGYSGSAAFAMGKFALRGLAQSAARELGPLGIHVAHFVIDGAVRKPDAQDPEEKTLSPDDIAQTYFDVARQKRSAWSLEVELRPWVEKF